MTAFYSVDRPGLKAGMYESNARVFKLAFVECVMGFDGSSNRAQLNSAPDLRFRIRW